MSQSAVESGAITDAECATCGAVEPGTPPPSWSAANQTGRRVWTCGRCARDHIRSIEGKLDSPWW